MNDQHWVVRSSDGFVLASIPEVYEVTSDESGVIELTRQVEQHYEPVCVIPPSFAGFLVRVK